MRDYGKVYATFWSSGTTSKLSDDGKLLALYLMTCGHSTIAGVFRLPDGYVAEDLNWDQERVAKGFSELFAKGFADRCATTKWVWIRKHLEWNKPENPNQRKSAAKIALSVPEECCWRLDFIEKSHETLGIEWNPSETLSEPFLNQKQKQKQEQKQDSPSLRSGEGASDDATPTVDKKSKRKTLRTYLAECKRAKTKPVPDDHAIRRWAADAGVTPEMLQIAWVKFRERYTEGEKGKGKLYTRWADHFATAVKDNWFKLWFADDEGVKWTTQGLTCKTVLDAQMKQQEAAHAA